MLFIFYMIVRAGLDRFPIGILVVFIRQGQGLRLVQGFKQFQTALADFFHELAVELLQQLSDGLVHVG